MNKTKFEVFSFSWFMQKVTEKIMINKKWLRSCHIFFCNYDFCTLTATTVEHTKCNYIIYQLKWQNYVQNKIRSIFIQLIYAENISKIYIHINKKCLYFVAIHFLQLLFFHPHPHPPSATNIQLTNRNYNMYQLKWLNNLQNKFRTIFIQLAYAENISKSYKRSTKNGYAVEIHFFFFCNYDFYTLSATFSLLSLITQRST